jgi:hypothetical protein
MIANALWGDFARERVLRVRYSRRPDISIAATRENIPSRKKMTLRFIAA